MTRGHSERSEAESKLQRSRRIRRGQAFNPVAKPMSNRPGSLDFVRDDVLVVLM
jgi:hypothetical protein